MTRREVLDGGRPNPRFPSPQPSIDAMKIQPVRPGTFARTALLTVALLSLPALGQVPGFTFDSGSNGSLGDVVITNDTTLLLPPDGVLHYKSFAIRNDAVVSFIKNANNTPVYLLSQGDVLIEGRLIVNGWGSVGVYGAGLGGPGGFDGGRPGAGGLPPGDGQGPGGGKAGSEAGRERADSAGSGSFLTQAGVGSTNLGATYGNSVLIPLIGGSGGGGTPSYGGGGGGGAILIASNTKITIGGSGSHQIDATGGEWGTGNAYNGGSGGAVKLVAPHLRGWMRILVNNRNGTGGHGRVRLDALDYSGVRFDVVHPPASLSFGSMMATGLESQLPRLELVSVAGRPLPTNSVATGFILLPNGSAGEQPVVVRARNFGTRVPVSVVVQPDNGPTVEIPVILDNVAANPATATVTVSIPANTPVKVNAWTR